MGDFSHPLQGRFSRPDVTRSRVAHQAVFGGQPPADLIYVTGYLDHPYTVNPIRIRVYDRAGNPLGAVRLNSIRDHDYTGLADVGDFLHDPAHGYVLSATDRDGGSLEIFGDAVIDVAIQDIVADRDGMIYCAMAPGNRAAWKPKPGYSMAYVLAELSQVSGTAWDIRLQELATQVDIYFYGYFRKYRRNGDRVPFPELHGGLILSLALDTDGNIYTGGVAVGGPQNMLRKYDSSGSLQWSLGTAEPASGSGLMGVYQLILDGANYIYVIGVEGAKSFFKKVNHDGVVQWTRRLPNGTSFKTLALDDEGYLYTGGYAAGYTVDDSAAVTYFNAAQDYVSIQKWDSNGALVNTALFESVRYYPNGSVVVSEADIFLIIYANGELHLKARWSQNTDPYLVCGKDLVLHKPAMPMANYVPASGLSYVGYYDTLAIDSAGRQYLPRFTENNQILINGVAIGIPMAHLAVYDGAGDKVWTDRNALGDTTYPYSDPLSEYILDTNTGWSAGHTGWSVGLDTAFTPYLTNGDAMVVYRQYVLTGRAIYLLQDSATPALALPIGLAAPSWLGDLYSAIPALPLAVPLGIPVWFLDYVGRLRATVYRLFLTGTPDLELPISSFQVRRNTNRRWLSVVIPIADSGIIAGITARAAGTLVLLRGVRLDSGEQLTEMMRATLTGVRLDSGANQSSVTLEGTATEPLSQKTRLLRGVSYRAAEDGRRRARGEVDTYLAPGDVVDVGNGESFVVGELVYSVNPVTAVMEVTEARP